MNPIKEAALAMDKAKEDHPGLAMRMVLRNAEGIEIHAHYKMRDMMRVVTWTMLDFAQINILTAEVALIVNKLTAQPATV